MRKAPFWRIMKRQPRSGAMMKFQVRTTKPKASLLSASLLAMALAAVPGLSRSADGLQLPAASALWPQWQARLSLQTTSFSPLSMNRLFESASPQRGVLGAALLGDYYFATPDFGRFRASGGVMLGAQGGVPLAGKASDSHWAWALSGGALPGQPAAGDPPAGAASYLGLGFTSSGWHDGLAVTADVGLMSERPGAAYGMARALFGNQGSDYSLREMRLSPVLQLGLRYTF
jgi:hypothetical protein